MEFLDSRLLLGVAAFAILYLVFRFLTAYGRGSQNYERQVEKILNSDEYKVKGRFED